MQIEISKDDAVNLDKMLSWMASIQSGSFETSHFKEELFQDFEDWKIDHLIEILIQYTPPIVNGDDSPYISIEPAGRRFVSDGGFTALFDKQINEQEYKSEFSKLEFEQLQLSVEDLRKKFFDYDATKKLAKNAKRWSIAASVGTVLTAILLLIQWMCNRPS